MPVAEKHGTIPAVSRITILLVVLLTASAAGLEAQASDSPLRPGDRVFVRAGSDTIWADSLPVDADGKIYLPRVGALNLRTVPASAAPSLVRAALASLYRTADATVVPLRRVTVAGEARKSGVYFLPPEATLRDAVAIAQGANDIGNANRLTLLRDGNQAVIQHWIDTAEGSQSIASGDVLIISRESWLKRNALSIISTAAIVVTTIVAVTR